MVPSTEAFRPQLGKKQSKIGEFGKITKISPAATSPKGHVPKITTAAQLGNLCRVTNKRKHDATDAEGGSNGKERIEAPGVKKVGIIASERADALPSHDL
jgi:hypothetical protein